MLTPHSDLWLHGWILLGWTALAVAQASGTELLHDEAYYWNYAQHLDWGYFHLPPTLIIWWYWARVRLDRGMPVSPTF